MKNKTSKSRDKQTVTLIAKLKREKGTLKYMVKVRDKRISSLVRALGLLQAAIIKELKRDLAEANKTISRLVSEKQKRKS